MSVYQNNIELLKGSEYRGLAVQSDQPLVKKYLDALCNTIMRGLVEYPRTFALRIDLRLPRTLDLEFCFNHKGVINRFVESLESQVHACQARSLSEGKRVHPCRIRCVWAREEGAEGRPHWHMVLLFNKDAFFTAGKPNSNSDNLSYCIQVAWVRALGLDWINHQGLVYFPRSGQYWLKADFKKHCSPGQVKGFAELFYRASYLCKLSTKAYGRRLHSFGYSRR